MRGAPLFQAKETAQLLFIEYFGKSIDHTKRELKWTYMDAPDLSTNLHGHPT